MARGTVVGYEALARFTGYPVRDPETWFAAARRHEVLPALEAVALRTALAARSELPGNTFLTVNLGPDVIDSPEVREVLAAQPGLSGVVVELTEHARVDSYASLEPAIDRLRTAGALIAIDDAGSGYAGLQHLLSLRPEFLKLDRGLVAGLDRDEAKRTLVEMVGLLASRLDAWLLAEGVETREELDCLSGWACRSRRGTTCPGPAPAGRRSTRRRRCTCWPVPPCAADGRSAPCSRRRSWSATRTPIRPAGSWTTPSTWWSSSTRRPGRWPP